MRTDSTIMEADSTTIENDSFDVYEPCDIDRESSLIDELSKNHGFFHNVIRPMLLPGHESELLEWMKDFNLIPPSAKCSKELPGCGMIWTPTRVVDKYQWQCNKCNQKTHIRENSFFKNVYCSLSMSFKIILAWCQDMEFNTVASALGIKSAIVGSIYDKVENVVKGHIPPQMGGPGGVLMVDLYPEMVGEFYPDSSKNDSSPKSYYKILCLADTKHIPTQYWLHVITGFIVLQTENNNTNLKKANLCDEVLSILEKIVLPGGYCSIGGGTHLENVLKRCRESDLFAGAASAANLSLHSDNDMQSFLTTGIWMPAIKLCEAAQDLPKNKMQTYLNCAAWRRQTDSLDIFQSVVQLIAEQDSSVFKSKGSSKQRKPSFSVMNKPSI